MQPEVRVQFFKTQSCRFYPACRYGIACPFSHNQHEVKVRPDLTKTSLCREWQNGTCLLNASRCRFAHGYHDMRSTLLLRKSNLMSSEMKDQRCITTDSAGGSHQPVLAPPHAQALLAPQQTVTLDWAHARCIRDSRAECASLKPTAKLQDDHDQDIKELKSAMLLERVTNLLVKVQNMQRSRQLLDDPSEHTREEVFSL